jgi:hypothetical protein
MAACFYFIEERFMKMSDVWSKELTYGTYNDAYVGASKLSVGFGVLFNNEEPARAICYAVNNHDRMADEVAELRKENNKLKSMIDNGLGWEDMKGGTIQDVS